MVTTDDFIASYTAICARPRARQHAIQNVKTWLKDYGGIYEPESQYINSTEDLVTIVHRVKTPLRRFLEHIELFRYSRIFRERRERVSRIFVPTHTYRRDENVNIMKDSNFTGL